MKGYTAAQIVEAEAPLLAADVPLMARAAKALAQITADEADELALPMKGPQVLMLIGAGNNGGDALYAASHLERTGLRVGLVSVASRTHEGGLKAALEAGATLLVDVGAEREEAAEAAGEAAQTAGIVVDAILGTGSAGRAKLRDTPKAVVDAVKTIQERRESDGDPLVVVAADVPSGLDPDTGVAHLPSILPATVTATFGACKAGLLLEDGPAFAGEVVEVDIGLKENLTGVVPKVP